MQDFVEHLSGMFRRKHVHHALPHALVAIGVESYNCLGYILSEYDSNFDRTRTFVFHFVNDSVLAGLGTFDTVDCSHSSDGIPF